MVCRVAFASPHNLLVLTNLPATGVKTIVPSPPSPGTISGTHRLRPLISTNAIVTGRENRLGPTLPGFRYTTPSCSPIAARCEWPLTTTSTPATTGSISKSASECTR